MTNSGVLTNSRLAVVTLAAVVACGCGQSPITSQRIEAALAPTFANLVQAQVASLGLPAIAATDLAVTARCRKPVGGAIGSGDWVCAVMWKGPGRQPLGDSYELFVTTDGCYSATAATENLGGPTLKRKGRP